MVAMVTHSPQVNALVVALIEQPSYYFSDALLARALYDYDAQSDEELSFRAGNIELSIPPCSLFIFISLFQFLRIDRRAAGDYGRGRYSRLVGRRARREEGPRARRLRDASSPSACQGRRRGRADI